MPRIHSLALRLARVAHGELDAAVAGGNGHDWDLAAADLLVHEAGGVMTNLAGRIAGSTICMTLCTARFSRPGAPDTQRCSIWCVAAAKEFA